MIKFMGNSSGGIFIHALIVLGVCSAISLTIFTQAKEINGRTRFPRIKSEMQMFHHKLTQLLTTADAFDCTGSGGMNCSLKTATLLALNTPIAGGQCAAPPCKIAVVPGTFSFNNATKVIQGKIGYEGKEISIKDLDFSVEIPAEVLQQASYRCPDATPIFRGYTSSGEMICHALPTSCSGNQYLASFSPNDLSYKCVNVRPTPGCAGRTFFTEFNWNGDGQYQTQCGSQMDPMAYFSFSPSVFVTPPSTSGSGPSAPPPVVVIPTPAPTPAPTPTPTPTPGRFYYWDTNIVENVGTCSATACGTTGLQSRRYTTCLRDDMVPSDPGFCGDSAAAPIPCNAVACAEPTPTPTPGNPTPTPTPTPARVTISCSSVNGSEGTWGSYIPGDQRFTIPGSFVFYYQAGSLEIASNCSGAAGGDSDGSGSGGGE